MDAALSNWKSLNDFLRNATEQDCIDLLRQERKGKARVQFLIRIHGRFNVLRAERERGELLTEKGKKRAA
jgi:hypothetical protein